MVEEPVSGQMGGGIEGSGRFEEMGRAGHHLETVLATQPLGEPPARFDSIREHVSTLVTAAVLWPGAKVPERRTCRPAQATIDGMSRPHS